MASVLTKTQLEELRRRLETERTRILRVLEATTAGPPAEEREAEFEEAAQRATERTQEIEVEARERALLAEVDRALAKLEGGSYGVSERTGAPIPFERLAALPWARHGADE